MERGSNIHPTGCPNTTGSRGARDVDPRFASKRRLGPGHEVHWGNPIGSALDMFVVTVTLTMVAFSFDLCLCWGYTVQGYVMNQAGAAGMSIEWLMSGSMSI